MSFYLQNMYNQFTVPWNGNHKIYRQLEDFAKSLGWYPSDIIEDKSNKNITTGHLFVEHGLENSAVISFLNAKNNFYDLNFREQTNLLKISYNNLVDIHIAVDKHNVYGIHNRIVGNKLFYDEAIKDDFFNLSSDFFSKLLISKKLKANLISLDDALMDTISYWKRYISSELGNRVTNEELSNLFNTIIFCRAIEDHDKNNYNAENAISGDKILLNILLLENEHISIEKIVEIFLLKYKISEWPNDIINKKLLKIFSVLTNDVLYQFINDFYLNKYTPYEYDFSIISKHALSRIYERYVSILRVEQNIQTSLFTPLPIEATNKSTGSYYTPQFIARFFSRYIEQCIPNFNYKTLKIIEPSVGSGIFLRTLLEKKYDFSQNTENQMISDDFNNVLGVDINITACHAAILSLSLLHLVTTGELPKTQLQIINANSLDYFNDAKFSENVDIVISNPPFVAYNALSPEEREKAKLFLDHYSFGRSDLYLSFIKIALDTLKVGGIALFVLPNTFLISDSAKLIRKAIIDNCFIKCIIDLSDIQVFDDAGVYPILLIFEKTNDAIIKQKNIYNSKPLVTIAKIQDKIGKALSDVLNQSQVQSPFYSIYEVNQSFFETENWYLLPPTEFNLKNKLGSFQKLKDFAEVRTGFSSGASEIFLIDKKDIPNKEEKIYTPYLSDREMSSYRVPLNVEKYLFYPFIDNEIISEDDLLTAYPKTFQKLLQKRATLSQRNEVKEGKLNWWEPNRPRKPKFMKVPKIVTPHLVFTPKFSVDIHGDFAISRTPFIVLKEEFNDTDLLFYFVAILNSSICFWYLLSHAPKYQHGYAMLERKYLDELPIPDPINSDRIKIHLIIKLVKERISGKSDNLQIENKIDKLVTDLYKLTNDERIYLNIDY